MTEIECVTHAITTGDIVGIALFCLTVLVVTAVSLYLANVDNPPSRRRY